VKRASIRPGVFLLLSLALSAPTLINVATGSDSALNAGLHLLAAILVARVAVLWVGHLVDSYQVHAAQRAHHHAHDGEHG
jgi:hypothetical protein